MPPDMKFEANGPQPIFVSDDLATKLLPDSHVRLKIVGIRTEASDIVSE